MKINNLIKTISLVFSLIGLSACDSNQVGSPTAMAQIDSVLTISDNVSFPYNPAQRNHYALLLTNHSNSQLNLESANLLFSANGSSAKINEIVNKSNECQTIAANKSCVLPIILPDIHPTFNPTSSFEFSLHYRNANGDLFNLSKIVDYKYYNQDNGILYESSIPNLVKSSANFTLAYGFSLAQDYKVIDVLLDGKNIPQDNIYCSNGSAWQSTANKYVSGNSCVAFIEFNEMNKYAKITIQAQEPEGYTQQYYTAATVTIGKFAKLTYSNAPLIFPVGESFSDAVIVTNHGTETARNIRFTLDDGYGINGIDNNFIITDISSGIPSCKGVTSLNPGASCALIYEKSAGEISTASQRLQEVTYMRNSLGESATDSFIIYRTIDNYVTVDQTGTPSLRTGESFMFTATLHGTRKTNTTITPIFVNPNPFNHNSGIENQGCTLNNNDRTCNIVVQPKSLSTQEVTPQRPSLGQISLTTTNNIPLSPYFKTAYYNYSNIQVEVKGDLESMVVLRGYKLINNFQFANGVPDKGVFPINVSNLPKELSLESNTCSTFGQSNTSCSITIKVSLTAKRGASYQFDYTSPNLSIINAHRIVTVSLAAPQPDNRIGAESTGFVQGINGEQDCIIDNATGFMWPKDPTTIYGSAFKNRMRWEEGLATIESMNDDGGLCGYVDWRMPNLNELNSIVNVTTSAGSGWLNSNSFNNIKADFYWTSTRYQKDRRWCINFNSGLITTDTFTFKCNNINGNYVIPVRGKNSITSLYSIYKTGNHAGSGMESISGSDGFYSFGLEAPSPRVYPVGDPKIGECVYDQITGYTWPKYESQIDEPGFLVSANNRLKQVNESGFCGFSDWRLPTVAELSTLRVGTIINASGAQFGSAIQSTLGLFWNQNPFQEGLNTATINPGFGRLGFSQQNSDVQRGYDPDIALSNRRFVFVRGGI